jgi:hypothetical protein
MAHEMQDTNEPLWQSTQEPSTKIRANKGSNTTGETGTTTPFGPPKARPLQMSESLSTDDHGSRGPFLAINQQSSQIRRSVQARPSECLWQLRSLSTAEEPRPSYHVRVTGDQSTKSRRVGHDANTAKVPAIRVKTSGYRRVARCDVSRMQPTGTPPSKLSCRTSA